MDETQVIGEGGITIAVVAFGYAILKTAVHRPINRHTRHMRRYIFISEISVVSFSWTNVHSWLKIRAKRPLNKKSLLCF